MVCRYRARLKGAKEIQGKMENLTVLLPSSVVPCRVYMTLKRAASLFFFGWVRAVVSCRTKKKTLKRAGTFKGPYDYSQ